MNLSGLINLTRDRAHEKRIGYGKAATEILEEKGFADRHEVRASDPRIKNDRSADPDALVHEFVATECAKKALRRSFWRKCTDRRMPYRERTPAKPQTPTMPPAPKGQITFL